MQQGTPPRRPSVGPPPDTYYSCQLPDVTDGHTPPRTPEMRSHARSGLTDISTAAAERKAAAAAAGGPPPHVKGCHLNLCCLGISIVDRRFLVFRWCSNVGVVELPSYLTFASLWGMGVFLGWLAFSHAHPNPFIPGEIMFDLFLLVSAGYVLGNALSKVVHLPPLFGYLIIGMLLRNMPGNPTASITEEFAAVAKEVALCIIVCRAGLGLPVLQFLGDPVQQRRNAYPPSDIPFDLVEAGMAVQLIPEGSDTAYDGKVLTKQEDCCYMRWNPESMNGPPEGSVPVRMSKQWWDNGSKVRAFRVGSMHGSIGYLSKPEWESLSTWGRISSTLSMAKSGLLLACTPMTLEALCYGGLAVVIFEFTVIWGLLLGFVMAAVSPAVVVPGLIDLQKRGFVGGGNSGTPVPALVIFASGLDDVLAITFFGVFFGIAFGGADPTPKIIKAPLEIISGMLLGVLAGTVLFWIATAFEEGKQVVTGAHDHLRLRPARSTVEEQERLDIKKFGIASAEQPYDDTPEVPRVPQKLQSNTLIAGLVFVVCVCLVLGFAHITVGAAGELASTGVLGAMCTCLVFNYHCAKDAYTAMWCANEAELLRAIVAFDKANSGMSMRRLQDDVKTRSFFGITQTGSFPQKALEYEKKIPVHELLAENRRVVHRDLEMFMKQIWDLAACPLLFSLVGKSIVFEDLFDPEVLPKALLIIACALFARGLGAILACTGSGWPFRNKLFVALAWMPKATVQAAVGGLALAKAEESCSAHCSHGCTLPELHEELRNRANATLAALSNATASTCESVYKDQLGWAEKVLQISVVGIMLTAPLGAAAISLLGPRWLEKAGGEGATRREMQEIMEAQAGASVNGPPSMLSRADSLRRPDRSPQRHGLRSAQVSGLPLPRVVRFDATADHIQGKLFQAVYQRSLDMFKSALTDQSGREKLREYLMADAEHAPIDVNVHVGFSGIRPAMRQRYHIKRSSSWPTSLALANPRMVREEWVADTQRGFRDAESDASRTPQAHVLSPPAPPPSLLDERRSSMRKVHSKGAASRESQTALLTVMTSPTGHTPMHSEPTVEPARPLGAAAAATAAELESEQR